MINPHFVFKGILPLLVDGRKMHYTKFNNQIYSATLPGLVEEKQIIKLPVSFKRRIAGQNPILNKILRIGPHCFSVGDNSYQISFAKSIVTANANSLNLFSDFAGSRPLNIEYAKGSFYFGEYFSNSDRKEVNIFTCESDKNNWEIAYTFPKGSIRHIHSIIFDFYRDGFWIQTGDKDYESALWFTKNFKTLQPQGDWSQKSRAVKIIPAKDYLIVPMDTPQQTNFIHYYYPAEKYFKKIIELPGSAFHAEEIADYYLVSTVVEPSDINKADSASIFLCKKNTENWKELFSVKKHSLPIKYSRYFRYPELAIVPVRVKSEYLVVFGRSLKNFEAKTMVWNTSKL